MSDSSSIHIYNEAGWLCPLPSLTIKALLYEMIANITLGSIHIYIVRDSEIMSINNQYLSCQGPTNVLSFEAEYEHSKKPSINPHTIFISVDTLHRESILYGQNIIEHFVRLLAHGLGHIMGYDHGDEMFELCETMEVKGIEFLCQNQVITNSRI